MRQIALHPMTNPWNEFAELYAEAQGETGDVSHQLLFDPAIKDVIGDVAGKVILDAGCGNGYWVRRLAKTATGVVGIDESEKLLAIAKAKNNPGNVEFRQMDLSDNLDLEDESFDIVLSSMVFHFLPSLEKVSAEISRVLKIDGKVVICVQHPLYQYHFRAQETAGKKSEVFRSTVGYFDRKEIIQKTLAGKAWVPVFNRPLEDYMKAFLEKGLALTNFREPEYTDELLAEHPRYKDHKEVPRVVILEFIKLPKS